MILSKHIEEEIDVQSMVILSTLKVSSVLQEGTNAEVVQDMVILPVCTIEDQNLIEGTSLQSPENPRHISCKLDTYICEKILYAASQVI